jgi:4-hydroxy-tetrahydrodipicolinate reductase
MKIALHGATGRMGLAVLTLCREQGLDIVGAVADPTCDAIGRDLGEVHGIASYGVQVQADVVSALLGADVVVDFSHASAMVALARAVERARVPLVSGTTGLGSEAQAALDAAANVVPVLCAPNFSLGIQVLVELARHAVQRLGADFDIEIVEVHHRRKADAPSGTAVRLASAMREVRENLREIHGRHGMVGARTDDEMAVMAVRGGDVAGDHTIHLLGHGERLELTHRATSREVLARGALVAARAVVAMPPGRYSLADALA